MKFVVIAVFSACMPFSLQATGFGLPWFHTRPKPVILNESPVDQGHAPARKVSYPSFGRNDLLDTAGDRKHMPPPVKPQPADNRSPNQSSK